MNKNTKIILGVGIVALIIIVAIFFWIWPAYERYEDISGMQPSPDLDTPGVNVDINQDNRTITIISIDVGTDLFWSNAVIINGSATLPTGAIDVGDIITDCEGFVELLWEPTNKLFLRANFEI